MEMCLLVGRERQAPSAKDFGGDVFRTWKILGLEIWKTTN